MFNVFNTIMYMSIIASFVAIVIMLVRIVLKRICPTIFSYLLWGVLLFRLITPISFSSSLSIFNWYPIGVQFNEGRGSVLEVQEKLQPMHTVDTFITEVSNSNGIVDRYQVLMVTWVLVAISLIIIGVGLYCWTMYKFREAIIVHEEILSSDIKGILKKYKVKIYSIQGLSTPIICGIFKPRIIIPYEILNLEDQSILKNMLYHEIVHMRRKDPIIKLISLVVACIHWFNPLVWIALKLAYKDMEKSCDEKVIKGASKETRKEYAQALLSFTMHQNQFSPVIAFGESNVKSRIKGILNYKKPKVWITALGISLVTIISIIMITDSSNKIVEINFEGIEAARDKNWVDIGDISDYVIQAAIVNQDPNFETHSGVDVSALFGAMLTNLREGGIVDGGSTITEQVVHNMIERVEKPLERKQVQLYTAMQLERKYSKDEIMEMFLNTTYFGYGAEGIKEASHYYFKKEPKALTQKEAAQLVAMIDAPTMFNLIRNKENNERKAQEILEKMK